MQAPDLAADLAPDDSDAPKSGRTRQAALRARLKQAGLEQVAVWVPRGFQPEMHGLAAALRRAAGTLLPGERALDDGVLVETDEPAPAPVRRPRDRQALPAAVVTSSCKVNSRC